MMEWLPAIVLVLSFGLLLVAGVPIAFAIALSSLLTLLFSIPFFPSVTTMAQQMATAMDSFALLAIPLFVLAGQIMSQGGVARRLIAFAKAVLGPVRGGLAFVNILSAMLFGSISGSAAASAAAIGGVMTGPMTRDGYDRGFCAATNVTAATTGLLIPPSTPLIIYSLAAGGVSIGALFVAGYLPGLLLGSALMAVAYAGARRRGLAAGPPVRWGEIGTTFLHALPSLFLLVVVIGGIIAGFFTATEAAGIAVFYSFVLTVLVYREVSFRELPGILLAAARTSSIVMLIVGASLSMAWVMAYEELPQTVAGALLQLSENPLVLLIVINLVLIAVGTFMDMTPALLIFTPIFLPAAMEAGVDPVHFGIIIVLNLAIGLCSPPVGSTLFIGASVAEVRMARMIPALLPYFLAMVVVLALVTFFPGISLWLPGAFGLN